MCRTNTESKSQNQDGETTSNAMSKEETSHRPPPPRRRFLIGKGILGRKAAIIAIAGVFTAMAAVRLSSDCVLWKRIAEEAVLAIPAEVSGFHGFVFRSAVECSCFSRRCTSMSEGISAITIFKLELLYAYATVQRRQKKIFMAIFRSRVVSGAPTTISKVDL